jgi:hypothetical protein
MGCQPIRKLEQPESQRGFLEHVEWMTHEALGFIKEGRLDKANRWLGFIQGVLWSQGIRTIDQMRQDNMPDGEELKPR